jgi:two-component system chemotaxis sensor kinase CheA
MFGAPGQRLRASAVFPDSLKETPGASMSAAMFQRPRLRLFHKLFGSLLLLALGTVAVLGVFIDRNVRANARTQFEDRLSYESTMLGQMMATALFGPLDDTDRTLQNDITALGSAVHTRLSLVTVDGKVVADSEDQRAEPADAPELADARATGLGAAGRDGRVYVARAIVRDGKLLGFARSSVPLSLVDVYVREVRARMAWGALLAVLAAVVAGFAVSRSVAQPVKQLAEGARRIGAGDFQEAITVASNDELGDLAGAFNDMQRSLRETVSALDGRNRDMRVVLDNIRQGLFTVDMAGNLSQERSAILTRWLGTPRAPVVWQYLAQTDPVTATRFEMGFHAIVEDLMPLDLNLAQMPRRLSVGRSRYELEYQPIFEGGVLGKLLVVVSDVTEHVEREAREAEQREMIAVFEHLNRDRAGLARFFTDADGLVAALAGTAPRALPDEQRWLHTLKGNAGLFGLASLASVCHELETDLADSGEGLADAGKARLRAAWSRVAEAPWVRQALSGGGRRLEIEDGDVADVLRAADGGASGSEISQLVSSWRHERVQARLDLLARQAETLAERLDKAPIRVDIDAAGLRCPPAVWEGFWSNLVHVIRNAIDHGLEGPAARLAAGKPETAQLSLHARREGDRTVVTVEDDGRGVDWTTVAERARAAGLPAGSQEALVKALFADGLSTREGVTETSGRGVGLAAVHAAVVKLGGEVRVLSVQGAGTRFEFRLPTPSVAPVNGHRRSLSVPARA